MMPLAVQLANLQADPDYAAAQKAVSEYVAEHVNVGNDVEFKRLQSDVITATHMAVVRMNREYEGNRAGVSEETMHADK